VTADHTPRSGRSGQPASVHAAAWQHHAECAVDLACEVRASQRKQRSAQVAVSDSRSLFLCNTHPNHAACGGLLGRTTHQCTTCSSPATRTTAARHIHETPVDTTGVPSRQIRARSHRHHDNGVLYQIAAIVRRPSTPHTARAACMLSFFSCVTRVAGGGQRAV
jgi:hypothetical protein